jgi:hypothetical protein
VEKWLRHIGSINTLFSWSCLSFFCSADPVILLFAYTLREAKRDLLVRLCGAGGQFYFCAFSAAHPAQSSSTIKTRISLKQLSEGWTLATKSELDYPVYRAADCVAALIRSRDEPPRSAEDVGH